jgi:murein DD-endopeptidase MepM/ murein hydrolase activator NlpD
VVFGHEAYRNGKDDGEAGQRLETDRAVEGHIDTALALIAGYGYGSVGVGFMTEALVYDNARKSGDTAAMRKVLDQYDSSADYWKLLSNGNLEYDGKGWLVDENGKYIRDKDGNRIGANGVEGGLLNILGVDAADKNAVERVRQMMADAGIQHTDGENSDDWQWRGLGTVNGKTVDLTQLNKDGGKTIGFSALLAGGYGNTVSTAVFMNGFDKSTDAFVFGNTSAKRDEMDGVPNYVMSRYHDFASAKGQFYSQMQALVGGENRVSGDYKGQIFVLDEKGNPVLDEKGKEVVDKRYYESYNNYHYGIDLATYGENPPIFAGISGTVSVVGEDGNSAGYGNYVQMEYGYQFEDYTYNTGIIGEYAHMKDFPSVKEGQFVTAQTQLGLVGNTGKSTGEHLHYSVYTVPGQVFAENVMSNIFGRGYAETAVNRTGGGKTVYDPTAFYNKYKYKY